MRTFSDSDLEQVNRWEQAQGLKPSELSSLSGNGWIEPGVAAGWLYSTDSDFCLLDGVVSNPEAAADERHMALDRIQQMAGIWAKALGFKHLVALCTVDSLLKRGVERYGYTVGRKATLLHLEVK
jgi:hypothetical protein